MNRDDQLRQDLKELAARDLYRHRRLLDSPQGVQLVMDGRRCLSFCSNDYLGLAADPRLAEALASGAKHWGLGSGSAHLVSGHASAHQRLEEGLADFVRRDRALLFSTGYMANLGVIQALVGRGDRIFCDRLNHASLIDGARLSGAKLQRYAHGDVADLARRLIDRSAKVEGSDLAPDPNIAASDDRASLASGGSSTKRTISERRPVRQLIVTDGLFSMDGDLAPLESLADLAQAQGAWLMVDDAHGVGVLGETGRGSLEACGLDQQRVPILVGTLGKAFGSFGAFVAGSEPLIEALIQRARPYVYTTALPPALAEATGVALELLAEAQDRRAQLRTLIQRFRAGAATLGLPLLPSATPIQPLIAGDAGRALAWSRALEAKGILVTAIRPPTVPQGAARLRITLSAGHRAADVDRLLEALDACVEREKRCTARGNR